MHAGSSSSSRQMLSKHKVSTQHSLLPPLTCQHTLPPLARLQRLAALEGPLQPAFALLRLGLARARRRPQRHGGWGSLAGRGGRRAGPHLLLPLLGLLPPLWLPLLPLLLLAC